MGKRKVGLHEVAYERLSEAEKLRPHAPSEMKSGNSRGPVKMWICHRAWCERIEYTYGESLEPPICSGGLQWSFLTASGFNPRLHREHLKWEGF